MERILLGALLITLFVSCGKSPEEKANALIEDDIKKYYIIQRHTTQLKRRSIARLLLLTTLHFMKRQSNCVN